MTTLVDRHVWVRMPDGTRLATDVYRPWDEERHPVVLLRTPYDRGGAQAFGLQINALRLVDAGYVVVIQDVRGRFESEGEFTPFLSEAADGSATIEWAAQQPWSNGAVAMAGMSYCGYAQVLAARERPAALRAWIPVAAPLDARDHWLFEGGAFNLGFNLAWMLSSVALRDRRTRNGLAVVSAFDRWAETVTRGPLKQPELEASGAADAWRDWLDAVDDDAAWVALSGRGVGQHDAPVLVVGGWFDLFHRGTMALHEELAAGSAASTNLLVGPWDHAGIPYPASAGDTEFGLAAALDLPALELRWLDHVLRGAGSPLPTAARTFITGRKAWQDWDAWPPKSNATTWFTAAGGHLDEAVGAPGMDAFTADAAAPTPAVGGRTYPRPASVRSGQVDQRSREARADVLGFTTATFTSDTLIAGPVRAEVWSSTDRRGADLALTLVDVAPDGRALNIAEGVRRRRDAGRDAICFEVDLGHVAHVVRPRHALRLDVAAGAFPRVDWFPEEGIARRTIAHGGTTASRLTLPIVA